MKRKKVLTEAASDAEFFNNVKQAENSDTAQVGDEQNSLTSNADGTGAGEVEVEVDAEEEDINSTHFDEIIEVEDIFGTAESKVENEEEEGEEEENEEGEEEGEEEESSDEETDDDCEDKSDDEESTTAGQKKVISDTQNEPQVPIPLGDINFGEDFFPVLSASGPSKVKKAWPAATNENIVRAPVVTKSELQEPIVEDVSTGHTGAVKWSAIASLSVAKAVVTAADHKHTTANSSYNSTREWSRKPKTYRKNNASMPIKTEIPEGDVSADNSVSVLPSKVSTKMKASQYVLTCLIFFLLFVFF